MAPLPRFRVTLYNKEKQVGEHVIAAVNEQEALAIWKRYVLDRIKEKAIIAKLIGLTSTDLADVERELETLTWGAKEL